MFSYAAAFNQDIGDWPVRVDDALHVLHASAFDQDIGDWAVQSVRICERCSAAPRPSTRTSAGAWTTTWTSLRVQGTPSAGRRRAASCVARQKKTTRKEIPVAIIAGAAAGAALLLSRRRPLLLPSPQGLHDDG